MKTSRRNFIKQASLASFTLSPVVGFLTRTLGVSDADATKLISFQCHLFRPKDLLDFEYSFIGAIPNNNNAFSKIKYFKPKGNTDSYMIVRIAQQHISELFYYLKQDDPTTPATNEYDIDFINIVKDAIAKSFVSGYSFLVFKICFSRINYKLKLTSDNLLYWNADYFELITGREVKSKIQLYDSDPSKNMYPLVVKDNYPFLKNGNIPISTFELPYKLYLTIHHKIDLDPQPQKFRFTSNKLKENNNRVEMWWNRIQSEKSNQDLFSPSLKVIGFENNNNNNNNNNNGDYVGNEKYLPTEADRQSLTNQFLRGGEQHEAETLDFRISPLGVITKIRYNENLKNYTSGDIIEWKQDINLGRDNYVKIVTLGCITPLGFKCKHIRIGERKIKDGVSFVEYKEFIEPIEFEKTYFIPNTTNEPGNNEIKSIKVVRNTPFKAIKIITKKFQPIIPITQMDNAGNVIINPILSSEIVSGLIDDKDALNNFRKSSDNVMPDGTVVPIKRVGAFWPRIRSTIFDKTKDVDELLHFDYVAEDWNGNEIHFKAPFIFTRDILFESVNRPELKKVIDAYKDADVKVRREIDIAGQKIAYYKSEILRDVGDALHNCKLSELETNTIQFLAFQGEKFLNEFPYYPQLEAAYVSLPVVKEIIKDPRGTIIKYADVYLEKGIEKLLDEHGNAVNNVEGILLDIQNEVTDAQGKFVKFAAGQVENIFNNVSDKLAGVVTPEMVIKAVSLYENAYGTYQQCAEVVDEIKNIKKIATAELQNFKNNIFKEAKLLGAIELKNILSNDLGLKNLPIAEFKETYDALKSLMEIDVSYNWSGAKEIFSTFPPVDTPTILRFLNINKANSENTTISVDFHQIINIKEPSKSYFNSETTLNNFGVSLELFGTAIIILYFDTLTYSSGTNKKSQVDVAISKVEFSGLLELVKQLQDSCGTVGKGLNFDISFEKILIGYSFEVPAISTGAFNLSNIRLGFDFNLYFKHKPIDFWFKFSERESPFVLSVAIYGGRGYFGIRVSSRKIEEVEAMLEFGGYVGIEVGGIARGCVYLMAGIFYRNTSGTTDLYGYVVCGGLLNVLGLVEMSMTFYLGMESHGNEGALMGTASVTVKIRLGFFKIERTASMTKRITGNGGTENKVFNLYSANSSMQTKTSRLLHYAEGDDSTVFDKCDKPIKVPDDCMLKDSLDVNELLEEYSNAFN